MSTTSYPEDNEFPLWQTDEDDCWFIHNEAYLYGFTEYYHGEFGKNFFDSEEECKKHLPY